MISIVSGAKLALEKSFMDRPLSCAPRTEPLAKLPAAHADAAVGSKAKDPLLFPAPTRKI
jgi:hypothetical protein